MKTEGIVILLSLCFNISAEINVGFTVKHQSRNLFINNESKIQPEGVKQFKFDKNGTIIPFEY